MVAEPPTAPAAHVEQPSDSTNPAGGTPLVAAATPPGMGLQSDAAAAAAGAAAAAATMPLDAAAAGPREMYGMLRAFLTGPPPAHLHG